MAASGQVTDYILDRNAQLTQVLGEIGLETTYHLPGIGQQTGTDWAYFGTDGLGSVRNMFDSTGAITYAADFDPYGGLINQFVDTTNTTLGFTGEQTNANGLVYLRARHYDPGTGTFLSRDPVMGAVGGPSIRFNGYAYAGANPVNFVDPSGEFWWFLAPMFFGALGGFAVSGGLDIAIQIAELTHDGMAFGDAFGHINMDRALTSAIEGGVMGAILGPVGSWLGAGVEAGKIAGRTAFALGFGTDLAIGAAWDVNVHGGTLGEAFLSNVIAGGVGEAIGAGIGRALRRNIQAPARGAGDPMLGSEYPRSSALPGTDGSPRKDFREGFVILNPDPERPIIHQSAHFEEGGCSVACVASLLGIDDAEGIQRLSRELRMDASGGVDLGIVTKVLRNHGLRVEPHYTDLDPVTLTVMDELLNSGNRTFVATMDLPGGSSHSILVDRVMPRGVEIRDPAHGLRLLVKRSRFIEAYFEGIAVNWSGE